MRAVLAAVVSLALFDASTARAWCRTTTNQQFEATPEKPCDDVGKRLAWRSGCVGYDFQAAASAHATLVDAERAGAAAFAAWMSASCPSDVNACSGVAFGHPSISAVNLGPVSCDRVEYNQHAGNANVIVFRDGVWPHSDREGSIALTTVHFEVETGEIYDADIEINGKLVTTTDDPALVDFDLQSILTHETGHFLGLAHTQPENRGSVMIGAYTPGRVERALTSDDVCGICATYPPSRSASCESTPRHGFASACKGDVGNPDHENDAPVRAEGGGCSSSNGRADISAHVLLLLIVGGAIARRKRRRL